MSEFDVFEKLTKRTRINHDQVLDQLFQWTFENDTDPLNVQVNVTLQDIAGNKTVLPVRLSIKRGQPKDNLVSNSNLR